MWPLIATGVFSLYLWRWTGDLRLYGWVQFFPCLVLPLLFLIFPPKYTGTSYWVVAAALYALAKLFEFYDGAIYSVGSILSGHTLKHFAAAAACFAILRHFQKRQPIRAADSTCAIVGLALLDWSSGRRNSRACVVDFQCRTK